MVSNPTSEYTNLKVGDTQRNNDTPKKVADMIDKCFMNINYMDIFLSFGWSFLSISEIELKQMKAYIGLYRGIKRKNVKGTTTPIIPADYIHIYSGVTLLNWKK